MDNLTSKFINLTTTDSIIDSTTDSIIDSTTDSIIDSTTDSILTNKVDTKSVDTNNKILKKQKKTIYWGIELSNDLFDNSIIKEFLTDKGKNLIPLPLSVKKKGIHSTLVFFKKDCDSSFYDECESYYSKYDNKIANLIIPRFGYSENALALDVESIKYDNEEIKSYAIKQHVTMALKEGIFAVDSVKTLLGEGTIIDFDIPLSINGTIKRFYF
jgi:hypothetical protein